MKKFDRLPIMLVVLALTFGVAGCSDRANNRQDEPAAVVEQTDPKVAPEPGSDPEPVAAGERDETYIRPEFQEFIDAYLDFYREYAEFMKYYEEHPTDTDVLLRLADMIDREADMVRVAHEWEEDDLTNAEAALLIEAEAEMLRITADLMETLD